MKDSYLKEVIKNLNLDIAKKTQVNDNATDSVSDTYSAAKIEERLSEVESSTGSVPSGGSVEGTDVLSTGETGGSKFLREDGDGTCSWQTPAGGHTQNTDTGTTNNTFTIDSDSVLGKIIIQVVTAAANKTLTLKNSALTDDVILTFPNVTGTLARVEDLAGYFPNDLTVLDPKETPVSDDILILGDSEDNALPKQIILGVGGRDATGLTAYLQSIFDTRYQPL